MFFKTQSTVDHENTSNLALLISKDRDKVPYVLAQDFHGNLDNFISPLKTNKP